MNSELPLYEPSKANALSENRSGKSLCQAYADVTLMKLFSARRRVSQTCSRCGPWGQGPSLRMGRRRRRGGGPFRGQARPCSRGDLGSRAVLAGSQGTRPPAVCTFADLGPQVLSFLQHTHSCSRYCETKCHQTREKPAASAMTPTGAIEREPLLKGRLMQLSSLSPTHRASGQPKALEAKVKPAYLSCS